MSSIGTFMRSSVVETGFKTGDSLLAEPAPIDPSDKIVFCGLRSRIHTNPPNQKDRFIKAKLVKGDSSGIRQEDSPPPAAPEPPFRRNQTRSVAPANSPCDHTRTTQETLGHYSRLQPTFSFESGDLNPGERLIQELQALAISKTTDDLMKLESLSRSAQAGSANREDEEGLNNQLIYLFGTLTVAEAFDPHTRLEELKMLERKDRVPIRLIGDDKSVDHKIVSFTRLRKFVPFRRANKFTEQEQPERIIFKKTQDCSFSLEDSSPDSDEVYTKEYVVAPRIQLGSGIVSRNFVEMDPLSL